MGAVRHTAGFGLGDLLAIGGALLYFVSKFLAFFTIDYRGVVSISTSLNGWSGSRGVWNLLEIILFVAVIAVTVVAALDILPAISGMKGIILAACGGVLLILTLLAFFDVRKVAADAGTAGGPGIGFILGLLFCLVIVVGGLMKMGVVPGDNAVSLGGGGAIPATADGGPFSSPYYGGALGASGNYGPPGGPRTGSPPSGGGGPYGPPPGPYSAPPAGNRAPGVNNLPGGGYPAPPGGQGGYSGPPGGPQEPYGGPPQGAAGRGGYGGPPPPPR